MIPGRPGLRRLLKFHFSATSRRCHRKVSGDTIVSSSSKALRPTALAFRASSARSSSVNRSACHGAFPSACDLGLEELNDARLMAVDPTRDSHQEERQQRWHRRYAESLSQLPFEFLDSTGAYAPSLRTSAAETPEGAARDPCQKSTARVVRVLGQHGRHGTHARSLPHASFEFLDSTGGTEPMPEVYRTRRSSFWTARDTIVSSSSKALTPTRIS